MKPLPDTPQQDPHSANPVDLVAQGTSMPPSSRVTSELDDPEVKDLGWRQDSVRAPSLIQGITNDDLFMIVRRFNKQVQHVRAVPDPPPGFLDLEISEDEEFSPDKLRANIERLYMTVIIGMAAFGKHIARLRSWNEPRRTAKFCVAYFAAWYLSLLPALLICTLLVLIFHPEYRAKLFPPAPLAAVSATTGNLQVPRAGTLGSKDSLSGAPEAHQGEAVEQEASHFVAALGAVGAGTLMGQGGSPKRKHGEARADEKGDAEGEMETETDQAEGTSDDSIAGGLPDPSDLVLHAKNVKDTANSDGVHDPAADVAKKSVEGAMWEKMRPVMRILADIADTWERFGNAIEPVPPFPKYAARLRLAGVLAPLLPVSLFVPARLVVHGTSFALGVAFFGKPVISQFTAKFTHRFPHWRRFVELRRALLKGVPTNAQLTLTLLRVAEQAKAPLPPPPVARAHHTADAVDAANPAPAHSQEAADAVKEHDFAFDTEGYEVEGVDPNHDDAGDDAGDTPKKKKAGSKVLGLIKKTAHTGVSGVLGMDRLKAKIGNEHAKRRLGAVAPPPDKADTAAAAPPQTAQERADAKARAEAALRREGPTSFSARVKGRKGRLLLVTGAASPCLAWVPEKPLLAALSGPSKIPGRGGDEAGGLPAEFTIGVGDVVSVRKLGGFGWKGRLVVGWATGRDVVDGLEVVDRLGGRRVFTAIKGRDELFNRVVAIGRQSWECL
ncbi:uncharacterized protein TRAVEDRAFT_157425 [Trametes versicolor FP-101664 SS1]|uniref:uncharacterized protein n=1 Tax=Trametes versicolor (strain FP-101664) TaxID=717944 RepID=UPI0004623A2C|nr:uncharacterized protein TRAVEDRAFT_157425 [Trametes versicolor FP-101664 SS1]EIW63709.1 hypothetical protein TRAVEDRAFT_157425 [Trametes versicolor FP-101664 SS1]